MNIYGHNDELWVLKMRHIRGTSLGYGPFSNLQIARLDSRRLSSGNYKCVCMSERVSERTRNSLSEHSWPRPSLTHS